MTAKCYSSDFVYVDSAHTDVRKTWAKARREMKTAEAAKAETQKKVAQIKRPGK